MKLFQALESVVLPLLELLCVPLISYPGLHKELRTLLPALSVVNLSAITFCSIIIMVCGCIIVGIIIVTMVVKYVIVIWLFMS